MRFRRISEHIRQQNWPAIAIDFAIVVIGVFIGLQVANWNEARTDTIRQKEILTDLLDDLRADQASLGASSALARLGVGAGNQLLVDAGFDPIESVSFSGQSSIFISNVLEVDPAAQLPEQNRGELWKHATIRLYPSHNNATIEALIVADNSSVLQNKALFRDLLRYRTSWTGLQGAQDSTFRPFRDRLIFVGQEHALSPLTPVESRVVADALRKDPALRGALQTMIEYSIAHQGFFEQLEEQAETLAARVEAELTP